MAISTQTEALLELYNQKISLDIKQLSQVNTVQAGYTIRTGIGSTDIIKVWGPTEVIEDYNFAIKKLDNKIVEINTQVSNIQSQILATGQEANSVGCGTTGMDPEIVYQDIMNYRGYSYSGVNPFSPIGGSLNVGNIGIGTQDYVTQVAIGSYFSGISSCYDLFTCTNELCVGYATTIVNLTNQLTPLQAERDSLIVKVNFLKAGRSQYELQNYAYEQSKVQLNASIASSSTIISFLQDPNNSEWL